MKHKKLGNTFVAPHRMGQENVMSPALNGGYSGHVSGSGYDMTRKTMSKTYTTGRGGDGNSPGAGNMSGGYDKY